MTTRALTDRRPWPVPADAAETMVKEALTACADKVRANRIDQVLQRLREGDPSLWGHCRLALAQHVGEYLEACDDDVKAVYIYDNDWAPEDPPWRQGQVPVLHLIVWAQPKTAALRALIAVLNRALAQQLGSAIDGRSLPHMLDVQIIDDEDVSHRAGYASLLTSLRNRPVQVWSRQTASA